MIIRRKLWRIAVLIILPIQGYVSSPFGLRFDPIAKEVRFHTGVDIASAYAVAVKAVDAGTVSFAGKKKGYGNLVIVKGEDDLDRYYGHLGRIFVGKNDNVVRGQVLGWTGLTGRTTGAHVHYEVRVKGVPVDPFRENFF